MRRLPALAIMLAAAVLTAACGTRADDTAGTAGGPRVVTAVYPLTFVAERVGGERASVESVVRPGADAHDAELTGRQVAAVGDADLVVYIGEGFQPALEQALDGNADRNLDVLRVAERTRALRVTAHAHFHDHGPGDDHGPEDDHGHEDDHGPGDDYGHDHEADEGELVADPHVWLDPEIMAGIADEIAERLGAVDPDGLQAYEANAASLRRELEALDEEFREGLERCGRREIVTSHAAFGYLAERYELEQVGITGVSPEAEPTPRRLEEVRDFVRERGVTTIFFERLVSPRIAETLARETGAQTAVLDPLESPPEQGDYLDAMRANLTALREALDCR